MGVSDGGAQVLERERGVVREMILRFLVSLFVFFKLRFSFPTFTYYRKRCFDVGLGLETIRSYNTLCSICNNNIIFLISCM